MNRRLLIVAFVILVAVALNATADKKDGSWVGWITDTHCNAKGDNAKHGDCATKCVKEMGGKYALYVPSEKKVFQLDAQDKAAGHAGHHVKITGSVEGDKITVTAIEMTGEQKGK